MLRATAEISEDGEGIHVKVVWSGVELDRPHVSGFRLGKNHKRLAMRLKTAIDAQAVFADPQVVTDVDGKTFVHGRCLVLGRRMNADLRRLGY